LMGDGIYPAAIEDITEVMTNLILNGLIPRAITEPSIKNS